jgi:hypothetical protein
VFFLLLLCCFGVNWVFLCCLALFFVREKAKTTWLQAKKVTDVTKVLEARRTLSVILKNTHIVSLTCVVRRTLVVRCLVGLVVANCFRKGEMRNKWC